MTTSFIDSAVAEATSLTMPTHQAGDMLVMYAGIVTGTGTITIPSGWRVVCFRAINNSMSSVVAVMTATSGAEVSGTWTSAELLACVVYRDSVNYLRVGGSNQGGSSGVTITYPALIPYGSSTSSSSMRASSWVVGFGLASVNTGSLETPPTDMVNRATLAGASVGEIAIHDTVGDVSTWPATNVTIDAGNNHAAVIELVDSGYAIAAAAASGGTIFNVIGAA